MATVLRGAPMGAAKYGSIGDVPRGALAVVRWCAVAACLLGCSSVLGIDGDYTLAPGVGSGSAMGTGGLSPSKDSGAGGAVSTGGSVGSGGVATGGAQTGGAQATGGTDETGGAASTGGSGGECPDGQKLCTVMGEARCVSPDPSVGCGPTGCDQCTAPPNGYPLCEGTTCSFGCFEGVRKGDACESQDPPGSGGSGTGGRPHTCQRDSDCPACGPTAGCCTLIPGGTCGCNFVWCVPSPPPR